MQIDIGIAEANRKEIAEGLGRLLADSYTLYLKTHNFHWNVTGPMFNTLHAMFEQQYTELATAVDEIAERIRALGEPAPGSYAEFGKADQHRRGRRRAQRQRDDPPAGRRARKRWCAPPADIFPLVDEVNDEPTADLLTQRMSIHEEERLDAAFDAGVSRRRLESGRAWLPSSAPVGWVWRPWLPSARYAPGRTPQGEGADLGCADPHSASIFGAGLLALRAIPPGRHEACRARRARHFAKERTVHGPIGCLVVGETAVEEIVARHMPIAAFNLLQHRDCSHVRAAFEIDGRCGH